MKAVLIQLALTSQGSTARMDANRGGGSVRHYGSILPVGTRREPHEHYLDLYNQAATLAGKESVLERAREALRGITTSSPRATVMETKAELWKWIVERCEGLPRYEAAVRACTGMTTVWAARVAAGREPDFGHEPNPTYFGSVAERRARVRELDEENMSARSIAKLLGLSYSMVLRDLDRKR